MSCAAGPSLEVASWQVAGVGAQRGGRSRGALLVHCACEAGAVPRQCSPELALGTAGPQPPPLQSWSPCDPHRALPTTPRPCSFSCVTCSLWCVLACGDNSNLLHWPRLPRAWVVGPRPLPLSCMASSGT